MNLEPQRRCLVLAARQALEVLEPVVEQVVTALDLIRVPPPRPSEVMSAMARVDVVLAEVSRPSPAISFDLGVATALQIPIVYVAAEGARVSPVFDHVVRYPKDESVPKLAFILAREVDHLLAVAGDRRQSLPTAPGVAQLAELDPAGDPFSDLRVGDRYDGAVVHADVPAGYVLVGSPDRTTAMLHVRNMSPDTAQAFADNRLSPGDQLRVEVTDIDLRRRQVRLRDVIPLRSGHETDSAQVTAAARLLRAWSALEPIVVAADISRDAVSAVVPNEDPDTICRWSRHYKAELAVIREIRNRLAHSEVVSQTETQTAAEYAEEALSELRQVTDRTVRIRTAVAKHQDRQRETRRTRLDALAPRVIVLCDPPDWPPLIDRHRSHMPTRDQLRLLSSHSLHGSPHADGQQYAFDRDRDQFLWFCVQGLMRNEGNVSAKVRLDGEAQFVKLRTDVQADPRKRRRVPLNTEVEPLFQERILRPGEEVLFEWAAGHTLGEWADAYERSDPPNPNCALFFSILITDPTGLSVQDFVFIEAAGRPVESVPGTRSNWQVTKSQVMNTVVHPTVRRYVDEGDPPPEPPWLETYGA